MDIEYKLVVNSLSDVFQALLSIPHMDPGQSFESLTEEETVAIAGSSRGRLPLPSPLPSEEDNLQTVASPSKSLSMSASQLPEVTSYFDDMALSDVS